MKFYKDRIFCREFDLIFFSRDCRTSWAEQGFRSIATEWHELDGLAAHELALRLSGAQLYAVVDLSGWLDLTVLQALATRPAAIQIKWVGGQSATTGLRAFDAFVSDVYQSPPGSSRLHSEPLARLPGGYVTYTKPPYMPAPQAASMTGSRPVVGIVAHPKKLSHSFLAYLRQQIDEHTLSQGDPVELRFVGWQYGEEILQKRLQNSLALDQDFQRGVIDVTFAASNGHAEQLRSIASLDWIVDTFPYTGGLTALEALAMGIPYRTIAGQHCSARHAYRHAMFAGLQPHQFELNSLGAFRPGPLKKSGETLLPADCYRRDHTRLATDLAKLLHDPACFVSV